MPADAAHVDAVVAAPADEDDVGVDLVCDVEDALVRDPTAEFARDVDAGLRRRIPGHRVYFVESDDEAHVSTW